MPTLTNLYLLDAALVLGGVAIGIGLVYWKERSNRGSQKMAADALIEGARREAEAIKREARSDSTEEMNRLRQEQERLFTIRTTALAEAEGRLAERESLINRQLEHIVREETELRTQQESVRERTTHLATKTTEMEQLIAQRREALADIAHLSETEARQQLIRDVEQQAQSDASHIARRIIEEAKNRAEEKARWIITTAIQRYAGQHTFEGTSAAIGLPGDEIKGRIIGREGRNIRAFEAATGVTVLIDDTPNAVVLSGFDPIRREVAREAMHRLIVDGRIHPTRIEEVVAHVKEEMEETVFRAGEDAVARTGLPPMPDEIVRLLGRLKFRHSFSQNVLEHSVEVAHLMGLMAAELGLDVVIAKRCGLLHDVGKAVSHEVEGPHALVGADMIKRFGECDEVVNGVASHHNEIPPVGPWGVLVAAADAISASRPGARSETMSTYIKRVEDLERIATSFPGVEKAYAVQAGRELRVMVEPLKVTDEQAFALARNITHKIEDELQYPGQIRVTVVRETRCVEFAK